MKDEWVEQTMNVLLERLPEKGPRSLTLEDIGWAVGAAAVTPAQIEAVLDGLRDAGVDVGGGARPNLPSLLAEVLRAGRELRSEGRRPDAENIAQRSGLSRGTVKVALLYAEVLKG